jgi:hypothetical protein
MGAINRINKSPLSQRNKQVLRNALKDASTTKYLTADQTLAQSSAAHVAVTGCAIPVQAGKVYRWNVFVYSTAGSASGGTQISFTGSATAGFIAGMFSTDGATASTPTSTVVSAITTESDATEGGATTVLVTGTGTYSPSVDGFFKLAAGQAASHASDSVIKKGSYVQLTEILV